MENTKKEGTKKGSRLWEKGSEKIVRFSREDRLSLHISTPFPPLQRNSTALGGFPSFFLSFSFSFLQSPPASSLAAWPVYPVVPTSLCPFVLLSFNPFILLSPGLISSTLHSCLLFLLLLSFTSSSHPPSCSSRHHTTHQACPLIATGFVLHTFSFLLFPPVYLLLPVCVSAPN